MNTSARSFFFTALLITGLALPALAQKPNVSMTVKRVNTSPKVKKADDKDSKKAKTESESEKLVITLRNVSREPMSGVEVKYYFITRTSGDGPSTTSVTGEGSKTAEVPANGTVDVESETVSTSWTDAFTPKKGKREKAHGEKVIGWGVKAMVGEQVAGESYSSDSAKQLINAPAEEKK